MNANFKEKTFSRRDLLKTAGKTTAGLAVVGLVPSILTACADDKPSEIPSKQVLSYEYKELSTDAASHPFVYQKLDIPTVQERAYASYFNKGGCCVGVADALIGELADNAGYPFNQIPVDTFVNGATGYGIGSLCGSLGGAVFTIGLLCPKDDAKKLTADLFAWYNKAELPIYQPEIKNETTVSGSVNCVDSVGKFMEKTGYAMGDPERKARCAGVTADVAAKTVELLNEYFGV
ncbi:C_GCAxxG_C_C family protein [Sedimentibacter hydroxybenzoicus DSM 7310]|uniref:C_GCAxxG_C_C family protein n=1 Tax=Sedimentibacter hydroxybenzoicus DSM 7310 TaxID=1123245 RepID=A0A974BM21_SEDHY|nr:C-GCAxxG-C-C family protein [Sedimentibacter hydroxybenzoicus]NYB75739.1 C_GCAxxG_C_C family protein [Sedimentibacter hydroxybenzoicus DSM 7310]